MSVRITMTDIRGIREKDLAKYGSLL